VEKELGKSFSITASYVGSFGRNLASGVDNNYPVFSSTATTANVNARRPYLPGTIGAATVLSSIFSSDYHGLQLSAERRGAHFSGKAYYTFGKALEDVDYQGGGLPAVQNSNRLELERARTSADRTHNFTMSAVWRADYFKGSKSLAHTLLSGWTLSTIITLQSGTPLTISSGVDRNLDGVTTDRPDVTGDPKLDGGRPREELIEQWFNTTVFALPALGADGTAGRSIVVGPGYKNVDLGIYRDIGLAGRSVLQLRMEATNVLNFVNLNNPGTGLNAPATFGKIRTARDMRRIQLGARLSF
jgi:hypothetical protein